MELTPVTTPASTTAEQDARDLHSDTHHEADPGEISIGVIIGRTSEFFDFFVFAIATVLIFPARIFPFVDPLTGTAYAFAVFALAFLARPLGTVFFMWVDRHYGRGAKLTSAIFLLGTSTVAMGFIPSYDTLGVWSIWILCILRIGQGFALGGAWDGLASLLALHAPENKRGWYAMIPQLGAPLGLIVASGLFFYLVNSLTAEDFLDWGWRYPFFVAFAINVVALFARLRIVVTPEYEEMFTNRELQPTLVGETLRHESRNILIGAFTPLASFALFHMVTVFPLSYVFLFTDQSPARFLIIEVVGAIVGLFAVLTSGFIADQFGRRTLLAWSAVLIGVFALVAPLLLSGGELGELLYMIVGFILLGLSFGQSSGAVASRFSTTYRYTGSAITSDIAWLIGAGFAPLVALWLTSNLGLWTAGAYLLSGAVVTLLALRVNKMLDLRS